MSTMSFGYHYNRGQNVGYNISYGGIRLSFVSAKDKARIIREIIENSGCKRSEISVERDTAD